MGLESKRGTAHYISSGMKTITVHVPKFVHERIKKLAAKQERSLQKTVRRILIEYASKIKF